MKDETFGRKLSRREMLKWSGVVVLGTSLAACTQATEAPKPTDVPKPTDKPADKPTAVPTAEPPKPVEGNVEVMHFRWELGEDQEAQFEADYPGITIDFIQDEGTKLYAMLAAGTPPDLYRTQAPSIPIFLAKKLLFDLTPYFETSEVIKIDDLAAFNDYYKAESPLKVGTGKIYGMCKDASPDFTHFINTSKFEAAGLPIPDDSKAPTYDHLFEWALKTAVFEGDRVTNFGYGYESGWTDRIFMNCLSEVGAKLYSDTYDKMLLKDGEEARKVAKWYFDLAKEKLCVSPILPSPNGWAGGDFTAGVLSIDQYGYWFSAMAETDANRGFVKMLPAATWAGKRTDPTCTATGMVMMAATQVPDAAWKVFEWYNAKEPAEGRAGSGWGVPAFKSWFSKMPQETDFQKQAYKVVIGELELNSPPMQFNPFVESGAIMDAWNKHLDMALRDQIDFDTMLSNVQNDVNLAIQEGIDRLVG